MFWAINFLAAIAAAGYYSAHTHTATISVVYPFYARESARGVWVSVCVLFYICLLNCWLLFVSSSSFVKFIVCVIPLYYATPHHTLFSRSLLLVVVVFMFSEPLSPSACLFFVYQSVFPVVHLRNCVSAPACPHAPRSRIHCVWRT